MRISFIIVVITSLISCEFKGVKDQIPFANNAIVAHRGAWKQENLPKNSIAALKHAMELNCSGSEFDVRMTADDVLIVNHDKDYHGMPIEETNYVDLAKYKLSNGETLPTLKDYVLAGMDGNISTLLFCEIKPSKSKERGQIIAEKILRLVKELDAEPIVRSYISFDYDILKKIIAIEPRAKTQYLNGSKTPEELKTDGISGLDYEKGVFKSHPEWIERAKNLGLTLNVWTVDQQEDMDYFLANNFDYITTNEPELLLKRAKQAPSKTEWELVWSDEFEYTGKPDPKKWTYDHGFIANQEKQYYMDSIKNARVEDGHLIIEAYKEKIINKDFNNHALINTWEEYKSKIETAQYSSARLKTEGFAAWKYGRIEVSAKLPEGRGTWPAIWMLSETGKEIGWPESGEIDIMEHVGYDKDTIHGTVHTKAYNHMLNTQKGKTIFIENPYDEFHVFAIEWTPEKIDFLLDGKVYNHFENEHKTTDEWPFDQKFHLILNVAIGGSWGGQRGIDDSIFPQQMLVNYVRVYQKPYK